MYNYKSVKNRNHWEDTTITEVYKFSPLNILGHGKSCDDYWSTDRHVEAPIFGKIMTRNTFRQILQLLRLSNNNAMPEKLSLLFK